MMPMATKQEQRTYQREWMAKRRWAWLSVQGPCAECGSEEDLQLDHVDPAAKVSHRVWSWTEERRLAELAKCQVLCLPCHVEKTMAENGLEPSGHGTRRRYRHYGCRCDLCRDWNASRMRRDRARRLGTTAQVMPLIVLRPSDPVRYKRRKPVPTDQLSFFEVAA
jgi:5-methylcytosine-specific restriction endonuclease McrA